MKKERKKRCSKPNFQKQYLKKKNKYIKKKGKKRKKLQKKFREKKRFWKKSKKMFKKFEKKTPWGETACLSYHYYFMAAQASSFLIHSLFSTQSVKTPLVPHHSPCSTWMTYWTPFHSVGCQVLSWQPLPKETEYLPRVGKYLKDVPLPTWLDNLQSI